MFLAFLIVDPDWPFGKGYGLCMVYSLCEMADRLSKLSHLSNIWCFFERFFAQNTSNVLVECFLLFFCAIGNCVKERNCTFALPKTTNSLFFIKIDESKMDRNDLMTIPEPDLLDIIGF